MTLTEFLLARIAEDEKAAHVSLPRLGQPEEDWKTAPGDPRPLAECEAKRQIVELFPHAADGDGWNNAGEEVLLSLAAVYADHPDYDEEWKP